MAKPTLTDVSGIGPAAAAELAAAGIHGVASLATATLDKIQAAKGFGAARAARVRAGARALLLPEPAAGKETASEQTPPKASAGSEAARVGKKESGSKKSKKKKNGKKNKKKKNKKKDKKKDKKKGKSGKKGTGKKKKRK